MVWAYSQTIHNAFPESGLSCEEAAEAGLLPESYGSEGSDPLTSAKPRVTPTYGLSRYPHQLTQVYQEYLPLDPYTASRYKLSMAVDTLAAPLG